MPEDSIYLPIGVGMRAVELADKFTPDNTGDNISSKNATYCELTAIYWTWKNIERQDYIGVAHYRRHFSTTKRAHTLDKAITGKNIEDLFGERIDDVILATPKRTYLLSIEDHYIYSLKGYEQIHRKDIQRLRYAIHMLSPEYDDCADKVLKGHSAHMLNMFIMSYDNFMRYCAWLFPVIDMVVDLSADREDQRRYAGALSEFCLDIWAKKNEVPVKSVALLETEGLTIPQKMIGKIKHYLK